MQIVAQYNFYPQVELNFNFPNHYGSIIPLVSSFVMKVGVLLKLVVVQTMASLSGWCSWLSC